MKYNESKHTSAQWIHTVRPFGQVSDLMESVRTRAVAAMKSGNLLALRLGNTANQHPSRYRPIFIGLVVPSTRVLQAAVCSRVWSH